MDTPLYNMLMRYSNSRPIPFHMPGHVMGRGLVDLLEGIGSLDITEIPGSDCLHDPDGAIKEAQNLAARAFGARQTYFSINGSTVGIHAMINAAVKPGGKILINRDAHVSVINAVSLLKAEPVYLMPDYDKRYNLPLGHSASDLTDAFSAHPDIEAVLLTRPSYYGVAYQIGPLVQITKSRGVPLLVDEAHGAHFSFSDLFPETALKLGADACVQSLHKTLPALTQTALVHEGFSSLLSGERLFRHLSMLQTTSPSYVLMASIDVARGIMEHEGAKLYNDLFGRVQLFDRELEGIQGVRRLKPALPGVEHDFSRIVLDFSTCGLTGFQVERILRESFKIMAEMADFHRLVLIVTPFHTEDDLEALLEGIREAVKYGEGSSYDSFSFPEPPAGLPEKALNPGEVIEMDHETVSLDQADGKISAATIIPYPPGIPLVCPGEIITRQLIGYLMEIQGSGGRVHGIMDGRVRIVR